MHNKITLSAHATEPQLALTEGPKNLHLQPVLQRELMRAMAGVSTYQAQNT